MLPAYKTKANESRYASSEWGVITEKREEKYKDKLLYFLKQKLSGVVLVAVGIGSIFIDMDITAATLIVPMGIYVTFTKQRVMTF